VRVKGIAPRTQSEIERLYRRDGARLWWSLAAFTGDRDVASDAVAGGAGEAREAGKDAVSRSRKAVETTTDTIGEAARRATGEDDEGLLRSGPHGSTAT
jgi:hypothetical protein